MALRTSLACLNGFIGVRADCGGDTPGSGLYLNDLPGLTLKSAADVASSEFSNGYTFLQDLVDNVIEEEAYKLSISLSKHIGVKTLLTGADAGRWAEEDYLATENEDKGIELCINQMQSMQRIRIHSISALTNTTGARNIEIYDVLTGNVLSTEAVALTAGQTSTIQVNTTYSTPKIWVRWNTNDIAVNYSALSVRICTGCPTGNSKGYADWPFVRVRGRQGTQNNEKCTFGLRVNFSVQCSPDSLLCMLGDNIKYGLLYACGIRFAQEAQGTDRWNSITINKRSWWADQLNPENTLGWLNQYNDFMTSFADGAQEAVKMYGGDCVECRSTIKAVGV